jgi:hypothetical protein
MAIEFPKIYIFTNDIWLTYPLQCCFVVRSCMQEDVSTSLHGVRERDKHETAFSFVFL